MRLLACLVAVAGLVAGQSLLEVFHEAVSALSSGDYAAAERGFQKVLDASPDHVDSLQNLGVVYARTNRLDKAIPLYRRALELSPRNGSVLLNLGLAYMKQGAFSEALPVFQTLSAADPGKMPGRDLRVLYSLTAGYLRQNRTEEAQRTIKAFLASLPPASAALVLCKLYYEGERSEEAEEQCRKTLELDPKLPGAHLVMAQVLASLHSAGAAKELDAVIREGPRDAESLYDLGVALIQEDRIDDGVRYLDRSMRLNPGFWGSYYHLGKTKLKLGQAEQAVPLLKKAAELNAESFPVFYELGRALLATGKTEEAGRAMQRVRELQALEREKDVKALRKR